MSKEAIHAALAQMQVTMTATFVPFSQSRNKAEKMPTLNWRVALKKDGRELIETDYMQGSAHCPAYKNPSTFPNGKRDNHATNRRIEEECENGRVAPRGIFMKIGAKIDPPDIADVVFALLLDASALDSRDFADWCAEYGYSSDSIAARAMYDTSLATGLKLRAAFGDKAMTDLRELFQDY